MKKLSPYRNLYRNNKLRISAPTWNDKFELSDGSYSVSGIQDYFQYTFKKHETFANNRPIKIFINRTEDRTAFKIKKEYYLESFTSETMKLLGNKITKGKTVKMCLI